MQKVIIAVIVIILTGIGLKLLSNQVQPTNKIPIPQSNTSESTPSPTQSSEKVTVIASSLEVPWALAFLPASPAGGPDNSMLVTERAGKVKLVKDGNVKTIATIPVKQIGEGGLLGIAIHPKFTENHLVFFYYTYGESNGGTLNRVSSFIFDNEKLESESTIINNIPGASNHNGGRIKFGPDGNLYITTGDAQNPSQSQDRSSLAGKILRVTDNGNPASNNLFNSLVYSLGHRNPQGLAWDSANNLWEVEHGNSATDEINKIEPGKNYGWPTITGNQTKDGLVSPILQSGSETWAPSGAVILGNSLFFAGLRGEALFQYNIQSKELKTYFKNDFGRIREVILGPDNMLYATTSNHDGRGNPKPDDDKIIRINPSLLN